MPRTDMDPRVPSGAGKRRAQKPTRSSVRLVRRDRGRGVLARFRISPAMIGVVAMTAAGVGTFATAGASAADAELTSMVGSAPGSFLATAAQVQSADGRVDVSRGFDRPQLTQQAAQQASQRAQALEELDRDITATAEEAERAEADRVEQEEKLRKQWVLPVVGYTLTARFGQQSNLWSSGAHTGLDFAGPSGSEIVSVAAGTVTSAGYDGSYGNRTVVTLDDGTMISYSHQSRFVVAAGDQVTPGQVIGYSGSTGNVTGPHLHLEVELPGSGLTDPEPVLREHGITP
ncbi:M23 family metallopeptidase [Aeromicrobium sp. CFBP 8757]|uniref:M23 family metallopeptidase n=1 Tax=Aeromicrobium sp. CFBP 8757 TaxID=2775288 RepID=UPI0018D703EB|nr:M23 family metallopeptidase [Aeromicrobium sp. CFBP 8757]